MKIAVIAFLLAALSPSLAHAQDLPACPAPAATRDAAVSADGLGKAMLTPDETTLVVLPSAQEIHYSLPPAKAGGTHGGMVLVTIPSAGTWQVSLSTGAWIDVLQGGMAVNSTTHGHGAACMRKTVAFTLAPGRAVIQLSATDVPSLRMVVSRAP